MITLKLASKLSGTAVISLAELATPLWHTPGKSIVGVVELRHVERTDVAQGEDKDPTVTMQVKAIEIARGDQENHLRQAMAALHRHRTATGTLDDEMRPQMSDRTIELTGGVLDAVEAARLRVAIEQWGSYIDRVMHGKLTLAQAREELLTVRRGLHGAITWGAD